MDDRLAKLMLENNLMTRLLSTEDRLSLLEKQSGSSGSIPGSSGGNVVGPASATDSNIAVFTGPTGKAIADGGKTVAAVLDTDNHTDGLVNGVYTLAERSKLGGIASSIAINDFLAGEQVAGVWSWVKKTKAETKTILDISGLVANVTAGKTLTFSATDDFTFTVPESGTAAILARTGGQTFTTAQIITPGTSATALTVNAAASSVGLAVKANATTPGNAQEWQNSSGTALSYVTGAGKLVITDGVSTPPTALSFPVMFKTASPSGTIPWALRQNAAESGTPTMVWFETNDGNLGFIGCGGANNFWLGGYTGKSLALATNVTTRVLISATGNVLINGFTSGTTGLTVKGAVSQSNNLVELTNSDAVLLASVSPNGVALFNPLTATNSATVEALKLQVTGTGAVVGAAGLGSQIGFYAETATNTTHNQQAKIEAAWVDPVAATSTGKLILSAYYQTTERKGLEIEATGSAAIITLLGHTYLLADSRKMYWGGGSDMSLYYDGTSGYIKTDEVAASDLHVTTGAAKTLVLDTPVYNDANIGSLVLVTGGTLPGVVELLESDGGASGIYARGFAVGEQGSSSIEFPHGYKEGTDITFHVHWVGQDAPTGTDNVRWQLTYSVTRDGVVTPATTTVTAADDTAYDTQYEWTRTDVAAITGTNFKIGDQFNFTLTRIAASGDAYGGEAVVATIGFHYQCDTIGSRLIGTK